MKINPAALALLAATAAAAPLAAVDTTVTAAPGPATTRGPVEACVMPNDCAGEPNDSTVPAAPEPTATFEACVMPDGCADKLHNDTPSVVPAPRATPPISGPVITLGPPKPETTLRPIVVGHPKPKKPTNI